MTLPYYHIHMKRCVEKTNCLSEIVKTIGITFSETKTEVMTLNTTNRTPIKVLDKYLPTTEKFTYLGSIVTKDGGDSDNIKNRISKVGNTFILLNNIWKSSQFRKGN